MCRVTQGPTSSTLATSSTKAALVLAFEALETIEPSAGFERAIARLLLAAYKRRLRAIIGTAPAWVGNRILEASESIPDPRAALFGRY